MNNMHTLYFPPSITDPDTMLGCLNYVNRRPRNRRNRPVTGRCLLRYFVSLNNPNTGPNIISRMTDELWKNAAPHEKALYQNLSDQVKNLMLQQENGIH